MLSADDITFYLEIFKGLDASDLQGLIGLSEKKELKAGDIYIDVGANSPRLAYIQKGLIRVYHLNENGDDRTLMLRWEHQFIASIDGLLHNSISRFTYHALEDTVLFEVDYRKAHPVIDVNPQLSALRGKLLLHMLSQAMDRIETFVLLSPEERYLKLIQEKPDIVNRVADKYIATMLGITPVSLSRIRKRIANQHRH